MSVIFLLNINIQGNIALHIYTVKPVINGHSKKQTPLNALRLLNLKLLLLYLRNLVNLLKRICLKNSITNLIGVAN